MILPRGASIATATSVLVLAIGCILPDQGINIVRDGNNEAPVRFVEPVFLSEFARCACQPESCDPDDTARHDPDDATCPQPIGSGLPHFMDGDADLQYSFCACAAAGFDPNRLAATQLWVEDQDKDDSIFAAAFLDLELAKGDASDPSSNGKEYLRATIQPHVPLIDIVSPQVDFREDHPVRELRFTSGFSPTGDEVLDLCNPPGSPLSPGWHTVTLVVTDLPWASYSSGGIEYSLAGEPDVANGATVDTTTYTFKCLSSVDGACDCESPSDD